MAQKERCLSDIFRISYMSIAVNKEGTEAQVIVPSFTLDDFDRTGNLSIWRLQYMISMARLLAYQTPNPDTGKTYLEYNKLTRAKYTFVASTHTHVDRSFYTLPDFSTPPSLSIKMHLGYVGGSSFTNITELVDNNSGFVFASNIKQLVLVDKTTRKPTLLPSWWKEQYQSYKVDGEKLVVESFRPPGDSDAYYRKSLRVSWNDIDSYMHTNYISYIRFCFDITMDALNKGFFKQLKGDILLYPVKNMDISFHGESLPGQRLLVKVWENSTDPFKVHFDISRDGQSIFQNTITFFGPQASL